MQKLDGPIVGKGLEMEENFNTALKIFLYNLPLESIVYDLLLRYLSYSVLEF